MNHIGDFFKRFANFEIPHKAVVRATKAAIDQTIGGDINVENLKFQKGIVYLRVHSAIRSEIMRRKGEILTKAEQNLGKRTVRDIV